MKKYLAKLYQYVGPKDIQDQVAGQPPGLVVGRGEDVLEWARAHEPEGLKNGEIVDGLPVRWSCLFFRSQNQVMYRSLSLD